MLFHHQSLVGHEVFPKRLESGLGISVILFKAKSCREISFCSCFNFPWSYQLMLLLFGRHVRNFFVQTVTCCRYLLLALLNVLYVALFSKIANILLSLTRFLPECFCSHLSLLILLVKVWLTIWHFVRSFFLEVMMRLLESGILQPRNALPH